jgi:serine/threonine protein kinase
MILKIYGISQNPDTKDYVMVLQYAEGGNFDSWLNKNYKYFSWESKLNVLRYIIDGLIKIHQQQMVHRDFHTGNILFERLDIINGRNRTYISDMGLCGEVSNMNKGNIYGVMPYVAPEVLRGKTYTREADIYSFGMIMYFVATGRQPFADRAHDEFLVLDICEGIRPEINELEAPKCYVDLMKRCWSLNTDNRPDAAEISELINSFVNKKDGEIKESFVKAEKYRRANRILPIENIQSATHPKAIYKSRLLNPFTENLQRYDENLVANTECLDCEI